MLQFNKCNFDNCNKKFKISALKCRCGNFYCTIHRLPENHGYIYIDNEQDKKRQKTIDNMLCISKKIDKL